MFRPPRVTVERMGKPLAGATVVLMLLGALISFGYIRLVYREVEH